MSGTDIDPPPFLQDVLGLLTWARDILGREGTREDHITRVALHLIDCAVDVSNLLAEAHDVATARDALGSARSAVVAATCAVRHTQDREKIGG
ncbi:hypothetical protein ABZT02_40725 [Streptomyces sp. NPDC005402]|uniref:hypothetical protein n=1 Tax=Streptomyces sp. NPDC005402 TaxID=3155338 RepID=UPI0033A609A2